MQLDDLFREMLERDSSDLHLKAGRPPLMRIHGELLVTSHPELSDDDVRRMVYAVLNEHDKGRFEKELELDAAHTFEDRARFRINVFLERGHIGAVMRLIPLKIPTVDELGLPEVLKDLALRRQGLILFTGPTGCGKSTSMAAMIHHINENQRRHVVTIEDPVEFVQRDHLAKIDQRQLGADTLSLQEALRHVLRQDPDVILIGEMRDADTMETAMRAAETGHLVFSTLHTNDAKQTVDRILESFEGNQQNQIRSLLSLTLLAVLSQRLIPRADGKGRVAALEIMVNSPNISQILAKAQTHMLDEAIAKSGTYWHMQSFNQALCILVKQGKIKPAVALENSTNPGDLRLALRGVGIGSAEIDKLTETLVEAEVVEEKPSGDTQQTGTPPPSQGKPRPPERGFNF
jgi:twitching motility protein PilT